MLLLSLQSCINDGAEFKAVADAMKVIGFTGDEIQTVYKILATILLLVKTPRKWQIPARVSRQLSVRTTEHLARRRRWRDPIVLAKDFENGCFIYLFIIV